MKEKGRKSEDFEKQYIQSEAVGQLRGLEGVPLQILLGMDRAVLEVPNGDHVRGGVHPNKGNKGGLNEGASKPTLSKQICLPLQQ